MDFKGFYDALLFDVDQPILKSYTGKQGDTKSRGLYVTVTQKNAVIDDLTGLSMRFFYEKPDKTRGFIDGVVDGNKFRIDYTNQMYAVPGVVKAELRLMGSNEEIITAKTFKILVDSSIADGSIISENERGILDRAFELAEDIIPRLELLDVELLEDVQAEMLGARHSGTKDVTYDSLGQRLDAAEQDLLDHKAEYTSNRQQDQLKVAKVEKELNDYKATMQQVNINQEATQKATGYGVISLPPNAANGQVSGVKIQGLTATNLVKNGDFSNGTTGWKGLDSTIAVVDNKLTATITSLGQSVGLYGDSAINPIMLITGHKYYVSGSIYPKYVTPIRIGIGDLYVEYTSPFANVWNKLSAVITATKDETRTMLFYVNATTQYVVGDTIKYKELFAVDLTATFGAGNEPTKEECDQIFANWFDGTKSTVGAGRVQSTDDKGNVIGELYYIAKDKDGNIIWLRSVPSAKDEIRMSEKKLIKRVSDDTLLQTSGWRYLGKTNDDACHILSRDLQLTNIKHESGATLLNTGKFTFSDKEFDTYSGGLSQTQSYNFTRKSIVKHWITSEFRLVIPNEKYASYTADNEGANNYAVDNLSGSSLNYQLAEPIEIPVQVSGTLTSYPNGTIYIERILPDAGVYTDKITILHQDAPIKRLDKLSKVDFMTGVETELDINQAEISEDKLSFTHPELNAGDIVFFEYEYDVESTEGETEVEFYDSRYVVKDTETGKFYKWNIVVANGQPSIELVEV